MEHSFILLIAKLSVATTTGVQYEQTPENSEFKKSFEGTGRNLARLKTDPVFPGTSGTIS